MAELTKAQKRAPDDAKCAWRKMNPEQRTKLLAWAGVTRGGSGDPDVVFPTKPAGDKR